MRHEPEIVKVIDAYRLIDAESYERSLVDTSTRALQPGWYVVSWSDDVDSPDYDTNARFDGPYTAQHLARAALDGMSSRAELAYPVEHTLRAPA